MDSKRIEIKMTDTHKSIFDICSEIEKHNTKTMKEMQKKIDEMMQYNLRSIEESERLFNKIDEFLKTDEEKAKEKRNNSRLNLQFKLQKIKKYGLQQLSQIKNNH